MYTARITAVGSKQNNRHDKTELIYRKRQKSEREMHNF